MLACSECSMSCINYLEINEGKYAGTTTIGFHASAGEAFGPRFEIDDSEVIIKANAVCNELGLDVCNAAVVISWTFELYEKGLIRKEDYDGLELNWGNSDALLELLRKLAYREGFGSVLADGFKAASGWALLIIMVAELLALSFGATLVPPILIGDIAAHIYGT